jgi:DNA-binding CsgD family transcriptional regulator
LQLAVLRLETGSPCDPVLLLDGAHRALASFDHALAERLARGAVDNDGDGFEAHLALASARAGQKDAEEAERLFAAAAELATADAERGRLALARAQNLLYGLRRPDEATAVLVRARAEVTAPDWDDELTAMLAMFATLTGDPWTGVEAGRRILQRPSARPRPVVATLVASTICQVLLGDTADMERALETGLRRAVEVEDELPIAGTQLEIAAAGAQWLHGRVVEGREQCRAGYRRALQRGEDDLAGIWGANLAQLLCYGADPRETLTASAEAVELLRTHDALGLLPMALGCEIVAAAHLGDLALAHRLAEDAALADAESEVRSALFATRGRAWVAAAEGDRMAAAEALVEAGRRVAMGGIRFFAGILFHDVIRLGYPELATDDLVALAGEMDGEIPQLWAAHARALAAAQGPALDAVAERFGEIAMPLYAAETAVQAADAHRRAGNARAARRSTARVSAWQPAGSAAVTVTPMRLHPLTRREREVAMMAARGLTSPQIAQSLVLSQRTVDNHLRSVYGKLGVHGRRDLAEVLSEWLAPPP